MADVTLNVETRQDLGKKSSKKLRREGKIPGIFYIRGEDSVAVAMDEKTVRNIIQSDTNVIDLKFDSGKKAKCVIRDIQWDPVYDNPVHVDLLGIKLTEKIVVDVPIHMVGTPVGVKEGGGILQQLVRDVSIECLPLDIPEHFELDVSALNVGDSIRVEDLEIENAKVLTDPTQSIVTVRPPTVVKELAEEEVTEEPTEPEVIGEKGAEESGEESETAE